MPNAGHKLHSFPGDVSSLFRAVGNEAADARAIKRIEWLEAYKFLVVCTPLNASAPLQETVFPMHIAYTINLGIRF